MRFLKTAFIFLSLALIFIGCGKFKRSEKQENWWKANGHLKVLTTTAMIHDLVERIGQDKVDSMPLIIHELDPHSYELVKGDDEKFLRADLIFYNGLGLEHGLSLRQNLENNPRAISLGDPIFQKEPELILFVDGAKDPHIWLDISLWRKTIPTITQALSSQDPKNAAFYAEKAKELEKQMEIADQNCFAMLQSVPSSCRFLVTSHDAFNYFARRYLADPEEKNGGWEKRFCAPEGLAPDAQLSLQDIRLILDHIIAFKIKVLFPESNVSLDSLNKIISACKKLNHTIFICQTPLYGDSMGDAPSYFEMIEHNARVIAAHLNKYSREDHD